MRKLFERVYPWLCKVVLMLCIFWTLVTTTITIVYGSFVEEIISTAWFTVLVWIFYLLGTVVVSFALGVIGVRDRAKESGDIRGNKERR